MKVDKTFVKTLTEELKVISEQWGFTHEKTLTTFSTEDFFIALHAEDIYLLQQFISLKKSIDFFICENIYILSNAYNINVKQKQFLTYRKTYIQTTFIFFFLFLLFQVSNSPRGEEGKRVGENYFNRSFNISKLTLVNKAKRRITGIHASWIIKDCFHWVFISRNKE